MSLENERQTRRTRIDPKLVSAGWSVAPFDPARPRRLPACAAVLEYTRPPTGPADYALVVDGQTARRRRGEEAHPRPAERAHPGRALLARHRPTAPSTSDGFRVPFLYSTNGEVIWFHDVRHPLNRSRKIARFHTPAALRELLARDFDADCDWFAREPERSSMRSGRTRSRPTTAIEQAIAERKRQMLVAMATGTGKTLHPGQPGLPADEVGRRPARPVPRRPPGAGRPGRPRLRLVRGRAGLKFDKIYEVYSQRFQREDFDEDEKFDPKVLPKSYLTDPQAGARLRLRLHHPAHGDQPLRPRARVFESATRRSTTTPSSSTSRFTPST